MPDWSAFDDVDPNLPGLVVGVATAGTVTAVGTFGSVSPGGELLGPSSLFYVASIAKQFTAAAVAVLALDGKLTLDDSVRRWLPELSPAWEPVRVGHLVAHTGGLPDGNPIDADAGWGAGCRMSTWDRVAIIAATEPTSPPGVHHRYSNHGYVLLAAVAERAADETLGAYARRTLFDPAGMGASRFLDTAGGTAVPGWASGTERIDIQFTCCGDGGLVTSLDDLARWDGWLPSSPARSPHADRSSVAPERSSGARRVGDLDPPAPRVAHREPRRLDRRLPGQLRAVSDCGRDADHARQHRWVRRGRVRPPRPAAR